MLAQRWTFFFARTVRIGVFFGSDYDPAGLYSFPTRRSSDLLPCECFRLRSSLECLPTSRPSAEGCRRTNSPANRRKDRKSTRLNSSHVASSYAVFCLKKKNRHIIPPQNSRVGVRQLGHQPYV